ncbi:unnamed protein product, partial [marine sediment metagenome]
LPGSHQRSLGWITDRLYEIVPQGKRERKLKEAAASRIAYKRFSGVVTGVTKCDN